MQIIDLGNLQVTVPAAELTPTSFEPWRKRTFERFVFRLADEHRPIIEALPASTAAVLGRRAWRRDKGAFAKSLMLHACKDQPSTANLTTLGASLRGRTGDLNEAKRVLLMAIGRSDSKSVHLPLTSYAAVRREQGDTIQARSLLKALHHAHPNDPYVCRALAPLALSNSERDRLYAMADQLDHPAIQADEHELQNDIADFARRDPRLSAGIQRIRGLIG